MNIVTRSVTQDDPIAPDRTIKDVVVAHAQRTPDTAAILAHGRPPLTYLRLAQEIDAVRLILNGWGIGRGDRVARIIASRSEALVAHLCVAGAATVIPLNPQAPAAELKSALIQIRANAVIVSEGLSAAERVVRALGLAVLRLSPKREEAVGLFQLTGGTPCRAVQPDPADCLDVAVIQMTSGTTAKPKAIPLSHALITRRGAVEVAAVGLTAHDVGINFRPAHLSGPLMSGLMAPLTAGGGVVVPEDFDADAFYRDLRDFGITWYTGGPAYHEALLQRAPVYKDVIKNSRLRFVRSSSYRLPPELLHRVEKTFGVACIEKYGGSEVGVVTRNPPPPARRKPGTVGVPFQCDVAILDDDGSTLPAGEEGQIAVRGPTVFTGYDGDAQATASVFVDDWYKTGDLGRFDEDGYLVVCGRMSEVINCGGQKISPNEVEAVLAMHVDVRDSVCFPFPHRTLGHAVGAAVVLRNESDANETILRDHIRSHLAQFKVPACIILCDEIPRGSGGKPLRLKAAGYFGVGETSSRHTVPKTESPKRTALVTTLAALWCEVLQLNSIGEDENFTLLGGDSLRAARLFSMVEEVYGVKLRKDLIFGEAATVTGMANAITAARRKNQIPDKGPSDSHDLETIPLCDPTKPCPLTSSQHRIWFLSRLDPSGHLYNLSGAIRLTGRLHPDLLRQALNQIVARHEILRAYFPLVDGVPRQIFAPTLTLDMPVTDLRPLSKSLRESELERIVRTDTEKPFDLERGPLIRSRLIVISDDEYLLLLPKHHIIADGGSNAILFREIAGIHRALATGQTVSLPPLPIQYGDFAVWQNDRLKGDYLHRLMQYWRSHLDGAPMITDLPTDRPRPLVQNFEGSRYRIEIPRNIVDQLRSISARHCASLFSTALAAFQVLIYRLTGQDDFIIGTAVDDRIPGQTEDLIGFFVNTLPIHARVNGDAAFTEQLVEVQRAVARGLAHRELPFERIVEEIRPPRGVGCQPLVQVMFGLMPRDLRIVEHAGLCFERHSTDLGTARFDLSVVLAEDRGALEGFVEYSTDLFDRTSIERMSVHFKRLLEAMVADPEQPVGKVPLLTDAERHQLLVEWNDTATDYPRDRCIQQLFEAQAARTPEAVAVVCEDRALSYAELNARANQLAHHLISLGVGPEVLVGICLERSIELIIGLLGVLKAGGAYVPLDPSYPKARLAFMLDDTQAPVLLTQQNLLEKLPPYAGHRLCVDRDWPQIAAQPDANPPCRATAESLAYVIYTSGSTGTPKGVMVTHANVARLFSATRPWFDFGPSDVWTCFHSCAFDFSVWEIWGALIYGGRLVMVPYLISRDPEAFYELLRRERVTVLNQTPSAFGQLMLADDRAEVASALDLRIVIFGGEALEVQSLRPWLERYGDAKPQLVNMYGITETTVHATYRRIRRGDLDGSRGSMIGVRIPDLRLYLLDRHLQPAPIGVVGEVFVGGGGVARGYLNRPELAAERFVRDPFCAVADARMYRTGDLARYLPDGNIEFVGRIDEQVKIRGFRIEPGEIESVLAEHPGVRQAVVLAREDTPGDKRLVAYVVPTDETATDIEPLRALVRERLPEYMHPSAYVLLEHLPLTPNGKVDRRALPSLAYGGESANDTYVAPRDLLEQEIAEIWCEVLKRDRVGVHDNFFDLGGHSLLAVQVISRIANNLKVGLPLRRIFEAPTIAALAQDLGRLSPGPEDITLDQILSEIEALSDEEAEEKGARLEFRMI